MPDASANGQPAVLADRYRLDARIGEGAHATTWRGWDLRLERPVAIKMLHARLADDPVFVQRFRAEARVAASVRQANVVDIYDFGQQDGILYIIMQYIDGEDLKSLIQRSAPLPIRDCRRIIGNVLDGLQAIHAAGIVHRDIKPQNVLVGTDGVARVTDFGVAEVDATAGLTGEGLTIGTVDYMAPEQAQGLPLTPAADLYATGVMLYEMLTGTLPFQGKTSRETMLQHINGQLVPPGSRLPERGITPAIDAVIAQSLAKVPTRRFGSARAMKQAVGQAFGATGPTAAVQGTSVMRTAPSAPQEFAAPYPPTSRQNEGAGLAGAFRGIIVLLLIGALGVGVWAAFQFADLDRFDFSLPSLGGGQEQISPTPTATTATDVIAPPDPTETPTEVVIATEIVPEQVEPTETPPIEPIEPDQTPDQPEIEPAGYDDENGRPMKELG